MYKPDGCSLECLARHLKLKFVGWYDIQEMARVFLPRESQGQGSLVGCSPQGCKESDGTEATYHEHMHNIWNGSMFGRSYSYFLKGLTRLKMKGERPKAISR